MKTRRRLKPIARWTAWVLAVVLPTIWTATIWLEFFSCTHDGQGRSQFVTAITEGAIALRYDPRRTLPAYREINRVSPSFPSWWLPRFASSGTGWGVVVPLWLPWLVALAFSIRFYRDGCREKQRRLLGCCMVCGYSLVGLAPETPCPECGALPKPEAPR